MLSLLWLPLFPMRSHLLIVLFHGNENVMHYFCLAFNIFSFLSTVWQNMSVFRSLFILLEIQWILGCVIFFFLANWGSSQPLFIQMYFQNFFFFSLAWIFVLCKLECLIMSPISENVYFCFLNWMIPIDLSSRSLIPSSAISNPLWNSLNFLFQLLYFSNTEFLCGSFNSFL